MQSSLKIAAIQYDVTGGLGFPQFMSKVENYAAAAAREQAELVVFPELFVADLFRDGDGSVAHENGEIHRLAGQDTPRFFEATRELARKLRVSILAGSTPRQEGREIRNTSMLAFDDGSAVFQDKLFLTACESRDWGWKPGTELKLIDAPWGKTLITICYDTEVPVLSNMAAQLAPELILVPSCTGGIEGFHRVRWTAQARAIEHYAYVVHTGTVGPGTKTVNMNTHYGQASLLTPSDEGFPRILAQGTPNEPAIVSATYDLHKLRRARETTTVYPARDQMRRRLPLSLASPEGASQQRTSHETLHH